MSDDPSDFQPLPAPRVVLQGSPPLSWRTVLVLLLVGVVLGGLTLVPSMCVLKKQADQARASVETMEIEALAARQALQAEREDASVVRARESRQRASVRVQEAVKNELAASDLADWLNAQTQPRPDR